MERVHPERSEGRGPPAWAPRRPGPAGVVLLLLCGAMFAVATAEFLGEQHALDRWMLFGLPEPFHPDAPVGPRRLADLAWSLTALGSPDLVLPGTAVLAVGLLIARQALPGLFLGLTVVSGAGLGFLLKRVFGALRPHHGPGDVILSTSFPSGHALLATLFTLALALAVRQLAPGNRALSAYVFALAVLTSGAVGLSRWYLGLHWPSDAVAGWSAGIAWVYLCSLVLPPLIGAAMTQRGYSSVAPR